MSARLKKRPPAENHERWLISYADFITLLFAFFVVMFASSQTDRAKAQQMSESITGALKKDKISSAIAEILGGAPGLKQKGNAQMKGPGGRVKAEPAAKPAGLLPSLKILQTQLKQEIDSGMLQVSMEARGLVVSLRQAAFFPPGQDNIDASTYPTIQKLAEVILAVPNKVRLEGHTDAVPIHNAVFGQGRDDAGASDGCISCSGTAALGRRLRGNHSHRIKCHAGRPGAEPPRGHRDSE